MKKLLMVVVMLMMAAFTLSWPFQEPEKVQVPVTVEYGDTMFSICSDLKREYGDKRDVREIVYEARKRNGFTKYIYAGDRLVIEIEKGR